MNPMLGRPLRMTGDGLPFLAPFFALAVACGGTDADIPAGPDGGADDSAAAPDSDRAPDAAGGADAGTAPDRDSGNPPDEVGVLYCPFGAGTPAPPPGSTAVTYDKGCVTPSDCAIGLHFMDCCGSEIALGINVSEKGRFDAAAGICDGGGPLCDCASSGVIAEDGRPSHEPQTLADVRVSCPGGRCTTSIVP
jgi:hypothetical protein